MYFKVFFEHSAQSERRMGITVCRTILVLLLRILNWFWFGVVIHIKSGVANVNVIFNSHTCIYYALCVAWMKHQFGAWNLLKRPTSVFRFMNVILLHCHHQHGLATCGELQGGKNKNTNIISMCWDHSTNKNHIFWLKFWLNGKTAVSIK